jgi:hypothetical protein
VSGSKYAIIGIKRRECRMLFMNHKLGSQQFNNVILKFAARDDDKVAQSVFDSKSIDAIHGLDGSGLLDKFFFFLLDKLKLEEMAGTIKFDLKRYMIGTFQHVMLYMLKQMFGIESSNALPPILFSYVPAMMACGVNAYAIKHGVCERGKYKMENPEEKQGPICPRNLADTINKIQPETIENFFNTVIKKLATLGYLPKALDVIIDSSDLETTEKFKGAGSVTRRTKKKRRGKFEEIEKTVYGFKMIVVFHAKTRIPLAAKVVEINHHESRYTLELLKQAIDNVKGHSEITGLTMDRGFLDGSALHEINKMGIGFVVPLRQKMQIHDDATGMAFGGSEGIKNETVIRGEKTVELAGIKDIDFDTYNEPELVAHKNNSGYMANKVNAVVVKRWGTQQYERHNAVVYITNREYTNPSEIFDEYDDRSLIENYLNREAKQGWSINKPLSRNKTSMIAHVYFTLSLFGMVNAYRSWELKQKKTEDSYGIESWRRKIIKQNRDKSIVFKDDSYAIMYIEEAFILAGVEIRGLFYEKDKEAVLKKYSIKK